MRRSEWDGRDAWLDLPARALVTDVVARDGFQDEPAVIATDDKAAVLRALIAAGVTELEATSFVHPDWVPQMADAEALLERLPRSPEVRYSALVPNVRGAERAVTARVDEARLVVSASEAHNRANLNRSTDETLAELAEVCRRLADAAPGMRLAAGVATAFMCPEDGPVPIGRLLGVVGSLARMGITVVQLADTTGTANPLQVREAVLRVRDAHPDLDLGLHLHDTRGMGLANALAGLGAGVTRFDASLGGLGGCPFAPGAAGNIATEDLVHMLHELGVETGIDAAALADAADLLEGVVGHALESASWRIRHGRRLPTGGA